MSRPKVYIDGKEGTTGLQIYDRLAAREDIDLLLIGEEKRKDPSERKKFLNEADLVFLCLPDAAAVEAVGLIENGRTRVIDCSTAHRTAEGWAYGFPELSGQREAVKAAARVANPGCYATGFLSLVRPLVEKGALSPKARLTCHALSGYTGAGKKAVAQYTDPDRAEELESPRHYAVTLSHKHLPEMAAVAGLDRPPLFTPMICDYPQGMVVTVPLWAEELEGAQSVESLRALYADYYAGSPVVTLRPADAPSCGFIGANNLAGTDGLQIFVNGNREQLMLSARLDNLGKGASGAAVQNMNLMLGFEETAGLEL
ncbi:N-acetyl-gamma-glutamyl-phosphate reductase [uncultured Oscillibacter sp.]|mgnify:FL=1|uniref:N-acetyl-gamma-glutamyl-phosphate reductase n=1 Tax=uncultured Oscillibacter sp. TaxID=876091 RepID=UPI00262C3368|nr:N-acetyl-gamma-glutamyl-phosphate reductase [uncultured Oscillibacter sp.]